MRFHKLNGAGNDFIVINNMVEKIPPERFAQLARLLCERHLSIGADGLMLVESSEHADFRMVFFNSDGSEGEMCGNGARCICRYGYEMGLSGEVQRVETISGMVTGRRVDARRYRVQLTPPTVVEPERIVAVNGTDWGCGYVELGTPGLPHAVVRVPGLAAADERELFDLGQTLRHHPAFPKGANVNFYDFIGTDRVYERTFERGVEDFTYACGTGTAAVALILSAKGLVAPRGFVAEVKGGELSVDLEQEGGAFPAVYLTGPTNMVAAGEVLDEELTF